MTPLILVWNRFVVLLPPTEGGGEDSEASHGDSYVAVELAEGS